jgi:hypothetical protein
VIEASPIRARFRVELGAERAGFGLPASVLSFAHFAFACPGASGRSDYRELTASQNCGQHGNRSHLPSSGILLRCQALAGRADQRSAHPLRELNPENTQPAVFIGCAA